MARYHNGGAAFQRQWRTTIDGVALGNIFTCKNTGRKGLFIGVPCGCCAADHGAMCPVCGESTIRCQPGGNGVYRGNITATDLWDCSKTCPGYQPGAQAPVPATPQPVKAKKEEANGCDRTHIEPEEFEERSAIVKERAEEALALALKHGHMINQILVLNALSDGPVIVHCGACDESMTIEQRRHIPMNREAFKGPILYFDCGRFRRNK